MSSLYRCLAMFAAVWSLASFALADPPGRRLDLEDLMKLEGIGRALPDPAGRWILFERIRPYESYPDYGFGMYAFGKSGHEIWRLDVRSEAPPEPLPGLDAEAHTYLQGLSPDGAFLVLIECHQGRTGLVIYELATGRLRRPSPVPALSRLGAHEPVWISDHELVYAALPEGAQPPETVIRMATGRARIALWEAAWRGDTVTATEVRNDLTGQAVAGDLIRLDTRSGKVSHLGNGLHADLSLSPDGRHLAALAKFRDPRRAERDRARLESVHHELRLIDLSTGDIEAPAPGWDVSPGSLAWAAEGQKLALFAVPEGTFWSRGLHHVLNLGQGRLTPYPHTGLDLVSERERGLLQRPERAVLMEAGLAVFARPGADTEQAMSSFTYRDIGAGGLARPDWYLIAPGKPARNLTRGLDGVSPLLLDAGATHLVVQARDGIYRIDASGRQDRLTPDGYEDITSHWPSSMMAGPGILRAGFGSPRLIEARLGDTRVAGLLDVSGGGPRLTHRFGGLEPDAEALALSTAGDALLLRQMTETGPQLVLVPRHGSARTLLSLNRHLETVDWGDWQSLSYRVEDPARPGTRRIVASCILMPPGHDPAHPPPMIFDLYPGARPSCTSRTPRLAYPDPHSPYLWAARGYAYARIAAPRDMIRTEAGPIAGLPEMTRAARQAILEAGLADPDRLILHGLSQGAVSALHVAARTEGFAAVIAQNGWADLMSHYFGPPGIHADLSPDLLGTNMPRYEAEAGSDFAMGVTPFEDPGRYVTNSPLLMAGDIEIPVLLIHTDMDGFPKSQFDQMYAALARQGNPVRYVWYAGEGHGISSPANIRDLWQRLDQFAGQAGAPRSPDASSEAGKTPP
jgi:predicted esterase